MNRKKIRSKKRRAGKREVDRQEKGERVGRFCQLIQPRAPRAQHQQDERQVREEGEEGAPKQRRPLRCSRFPSARLGLDQPPLLGFDIYVVKTKNKKETKQKTKQQNQKIQTNERIHFLLLLFGFGIRSLFVFHLSTRLAIQLESM